MPLNLQGDNKQRREWMEAVRYRSVVWGGGGLTCLTLSVWPEPSHRYLTAGRQQQGSAFVHHRSVSQNGLEGLVQDAQSLLRNPQHQLHTHTRLVDSKKVYHIS